MCAIVNIMDALTTEGDNPDIIANNHITTIPITHLQIKPLIEISEIGATRIVIRRNTIPTCSPDTASTCDTPLCEKDDFICEVNLLLSPMLIAVVIASASGDRFKLSIRL